MFGAIDPVGVRNCNETFSVRQQRDLSTMSRPNGNNHWMDFAWVLHAAAVDRSDASRWLNFLVTIKQHRTSIYRMPAHCAHAYSDVVSAAIHSLSVRPHEFFPSFNSASDVSVILLHQRWDDLIYIDGSFKNLANEGNRIRHNVAWRCAKLA